jgi:hypothetical protein
VALLFCDSCDHYNAAAGPLKYDSFTAAMFTGRFDQGWGVTSGADREVIKNVPAQSEYIVGCAFSPGTIVSTVEMQFREGSTVHIDVIRDATNHLQVRRGGTTVLATGTTQLEVDVWYYIEIKVVVHDTTGSVEVRIGESEEINVSGVDTRNGGTGVIDSVRWFLQGGRNQTWDDIYICDATGGVNDDFLGDVRVEALYPNGNGNSSQFVGSDGNSTDNYLLVDEEPADGDTTYVESSTVSDQDTYAFTNLTPTAGTVAGVQIVAHARKTDAGARSIQTIARHSGTEEDTGSDMTLADSYLMFLDLRETKPGGGSWSVSDVNGAEFGQKVTV